MPDDGNRPERRPLFGTVRDPWRLATKGSYTCIPPAHYDVLRRGYGKGGRVETEEGKGIVHLTG